jgi:purine-binding chemotaxis protein CheW
LRLLRQKYERGHGIMEKIKTLKKDQTLTIDWKKIHSHVEATREKLEKDWQITEKEKIKILKARTKSLARDEKKEELALESITVTEFMLANERYGIELNNIVEVYPLKDMTPVPCTPPFVLGIFNVRGRIQTIIDIKKFFDLPDKGLSDLNKVIIVRARGMEAGILADVILGIRSIPLREIQPTLPTLTDIRAEYMKGVTGDQLIVLDVEKIFSDEKIIVN